LNVERAVRVTVRGTVQGVGFRDATRARALELGLAGWVRNGEDGSLLVHAEGPSAAIDALVAFLERGPRLAEVAELAIEPASVEGHEQFAIRGLSAGRFVVHRQAPGAPGFELSLEVGADARSWALPKGPSLDPAVKRLAVAIESSRSPWIEPGGPWAVWDRGSYEQGGRVPWPAALDRGHAVFVLHGEKLRGGFALQRTGRENQWLLLKRRDGEARPGSDIVAERPETSRG
jgi:DNA ligase D-like protein (predicted 3'-phosphoesterase)